MMGENKPINNVMNSISKVFVILDSIKDSKYKYIEVLNPSTDDPIMKIKLNLDDLAMVDFLDTFFDKGFKIREITKENFDLLDTNDVLNFNI